MKIKNIIPGLCLALAISLFTACPTNPDIPEDAEVRYLMIDNVVYRMLSYFSQEYGCEMSEVQNVPLNVFEIEKELQAQSVCGLGKEYFVAWAPEADTMFGTKSKLYAFNYNGKLRAQVDLDDAGMVFTSDIAVITCSKNFDEKKGGYLFCYYRLSKPLTRKLPLELMWSGTLDLLVHDMYFDSIGNAILCGSDSAGENLNVYCIKDEIFSASCSKVYSTKRLGGKENPEVMRLVDNCFDLSRNSLYAFTSVQNAELEQAKPVLHKIQKDHKEGSAYEWNESDISEYENFPENFRCIYGGSGMSCQLKKGDIVIPYVTVDNDMALMFVSRNYSCVGHVIDKTKNGNPFRGTERTLTRGYLWKTGDQMFVHSAGLGKKESLAVMNYNLDYLEDYEEIPVEY